jgi:hypothetical protein
MRQWKWLTMLVAVLAMGLIAAGCGDDEEKGGGEPRAVTAASFVECFDKPGFEAKKPAPREESVLAFQAKSKGYGVEPVNVSETGMLTPAAFLVFFESPEKAKEAMDELDATSYGEVPPATLGPAVIGYGDTEDRAAVEPAIRACVE